MLSAEGAQILVGAALALTQHDPRLDRFALHCVWNAGDADLGDSSMRCEHLFDLARPYLVAARLDEILLAIDDEEVAVGVEIAEGAGVQPSGCFRPVHVIAKG